MTLHKAIEKLLMQTGRAMTKTEIADELNINNWYTKGDKSEITPFQIFGRTQNYPLIFERKGSLISLRQGKELNTLKSITNDIEKNNPMQKIPQSKIARICWNTNKWVKPSGRKGKSSNKESFEYQNGIGHEEWLLDFSKIIDGYHYAFLQPINRSWRKHIEEKAVFNISFYTINDKTKQKWWIGEIQNIEVINEDQAKYIAKEYKKKGWLKEMQNEVANVGGRISENNSLCTFNIRFKAKDAKGILGEPRLLAPDDKAVTSYYYSTLLNKKEMPKFGVPKSKFTPGHNPQKNRYTALYSNQDREINKLHSDIQTFCYEELVNEFGIGNVGTEHPTGYGASVDIVVNRTREMYYYEIKTNPILRECIRGAISQLLEYAHYSQSEANNNITKLTIITPNDITCEAKEYINILRSVYKIPIYYRQVNIDTKKLGKEQ